ncbi:hypothetical protein ME804_00020 [Lactobacillus delbrueckii]|uniref:hypothetical protein n=1 Tax=Lactobacillus delbrueckii TaxID=1584 RepID=UPI001F345F73|nr:hypothetical protein [Lactobacillus delbrueckii]GHN44937.1 hypothetical protein ME798_04670 [Lactobacillus delbrueckii]GHN55962.1 hypothetical protein ME804_00020 [Lactobacillus delbrueckii]
MPRGGFREGAGRPKTGRKVHTIRATDEEWKLIKAYAEQVKVGKLSEVKMTKSVEKLKPATKKKTKSSKKLGQLGYASIIFGNPSHINYGCFFCVPDGNRYAIKAYLCSESEAPVNVWDDAFEKLDVTYGYLIPATSGWTWENAGDQKILGPDPEKLSNKKTIKSAFACWLSALLVNRKPVRAKEIQER